MTTDENSRRLARQAQDGDRDAFGRLIESCRERLEAFIESRLGSALREKVDVEDVFQDTVTRGFRSIETFEWQRDDSFFHWVRGIAHHRILHLARQHFHVEREPRFEAQTEATSPSRIMRRDERFDRLEEALKSLSPEHREVILLSRIRGLPTVEVAERMNRSQKAIYQLLWRALEKLRQSFGDTESLGLPDRRLDGGSSRG